MGCNSCSGSDCDNTGSLDHDKDSDSHTWNPPSYCYGDSITSNFSIELDTSAYDNGTAYNKIYTEKNWYPKSFFDDVPDALLDKSSCNHSDDCSYDGCAEPDCDRVEYLVEQADVSSGAEVAYYEFENPVPNGDDSTDNSSEIFDLVVDLAANAIGGAYASIGAGLISAFYDPDSYDPVTLDQGYVTSNNDRQSWHWEINMNGNGHESFPQKACESTGVRFTIQNKEDENGVEFQTNVYTRYDVIYPTYGDDDCRCDWYGSDFVIKTTERVENYCDWQTT